MSVGSGRYIAAGRVLIGMTQQQLADAAGLHVNSVKRWEKQTGRISGHAVSQMLAVLADRGIEPREGLILITRC